MSMKYEQWIVNVEALCASYRSAAEREPERWPIHADGIDTEDLARFEAARPSAVA